MTRGDLLRRGLIFSTIVGLGLLLAHLLDADRGVTPPRPVLPVVDVPPGAPIVGNGGRTLLQFHWAKGSDVGPVEEISLDDGSTVPFRASRIRAASAAPLPSPSREVARQALESPSLVMRPRPRTRAAFEAPGGDATVISARRGILEQGPGNVQRLFLEEDVVAEVLRAEAAWVFRSARADVELASRVLRAPGPVTVVSDGVALEGRDLVAEDGRHAASLTGPGRGSVEGEAGVRIGGTGADEPVRFAWADRLDLEEVPSPPGAPAAVRYRLLLSGSAELVQGDSRLRGRRITALLLLRSGAGGGAPARPSVEELVAEEDVLLEAGREEPGGSRGLRAEGRRFRAVGGPGGTTVATLEGDPRLRVVEFRDGVATSTVGVASREPAVFTIPADRSSIAGRFPGAAAAWQEIPGRDGGPAARRDLRADVLTMVADRRGADGEYTPRELIAEGAATMEEGARRAAARRIRLSPTEDGGSAALLEGDVAASLPAAGAMDPLSALEDPAAGNGAGDPGSLLVTSPGTVEVMFPRAGGGSVVARGGALVRRVAAEREIYRLAAEMLQVDLAGPRRTVRLLDARGGARLVGEGEGRGRRRYDLAGERILVTASDGEDRPDAARVDGGPAGGAVLVLRGRDEQPLRIEGSVLRFARATGRFRAEGPVSGEGVLPDRAGAKDGPRGPVRLRSGALEGILLEGDAGRSEISALHASAGVRVEAGGDSAEGDTLDYDRAADAFLLRGSPARVAVAPRQGVADPALRDQCEAPVLRLTLENGVVKDARADSGGVYVGHRSSPAAASAPSGTAATLERIRAACTGPLVHTPAASSLEGSVTVTRWGLRNGTWEEWETLSGVDRLDVRPAAAGDPAARVAATAVSSAARISAGDARSGWIARGVSRIVLDGDRVVLEALPGSPRFRVDHASSAHEYRRVIYDRTSGTFVEAVGASVVAK